MARILVFIFTLFSLGCDSIPDLIPDLIPNNMKIASIMTNSPRKDETYQAAGTGSSLGDFKRKPSCSDSRDSDLELYDLDYIDASNIGNYIIEGRCRGNDKITIEVNGYPISETPYCDRYRWEVSIDVTPVATETDEISFRITSGKDTLCRDVKVAFTGPKNYLAVPPIDGQYESGFFVMKYEAKQREAGLNSRAISAPEERPISRVSYADAVRFCRNNGSRYDLINNDQWQNIARDIESVDENWSLGQSRVIDNNILNCGINIGTIKEASDDDSDDCATSTCDKTWDYKKRTHLLSSGYHIWDLCGNVGEMVKTKNESSYLANSSFDDFVYKLSGQLKSRFGPDKNYHDTASRSYSRNEQWGLGYAELDKDGSLIVRGGQGRNAGIFSVHLNYDYDSRTAVKSNIGFRCVYLP